MGSCRSASGTFLAGAFFFLAWLRRLVANVRTLGEGEFAATPNWSVVWWFVPIFSLFKPYQIVADAWSRLAAKPEEESRRTVIGWWAAYLVGNYLGVFIGRLTPHTVEDFIGQQKLNIAIDALIVIAGILIIRIVLELERRSDVRVKAITSGEYVQPDRRFNVPTTLDETAPRWSTD